MRIAGWITLGAGAPTALAMILWAQTPVTTCAGSTCTTPNPDTGLTVAGALVGAASVVAGLVMGLRHDEASITIEPYDAARLLVGPARREGATLAPAPAAAPGIGIVARW